MRFKQKIFFKPLSNRAKARGRIENELGLKDGVARRYGSFNHLCQGFARWNFWGLQFFFCFFGLGQYWECRGHEHARLRPGRSLSVHDAGARFVESIRFQHFPVKVHKACLT